jgi:hypothetical protein
MLDMVLFLLRVFLLGQPGTEAVRVEALVVSSRGGIRVTMPRAFRSSAISLSV